MDTKEFDKLVENRCAKIRRTLVEKAKEYARDPDDRLSHFKRSARLSYTKKTPEQALWDMAHKHYVAIADMLEDLDRDMAPETATVDEKIGDLINYLVLLEGLFMERIAPSWANKIDEALVKGGRPDEIIISSEVDRGLRKHFAFEEDEVLDNYKGIPLRVGWVPEGFHFVFSESIIEHLGKELKKQPLSARFIIKMTLPAYEDLCFEMREQELNSYKGWPIEIDNSLLTDFEIV